MNNIDEKLRELAIKLYNKSKTPESIVQEIQKLIDIGDQLSIKTVDLSVLINSGIECVFWDEAHGDSSEGVIALLNDYLPKEGFGIDFLADTYYFSFCEPRYNYWYSYLNFEDKNLIDQLLKSGFQIENDSKSSFRIIGIRNGFHMPWEN